MTIAGLQAAQDAMLRAVAAVRPRGGLGRAVQYVLIAAHRYETAITHVDTGALRAAHSINYSGGARGTIETDLNAVNPRSGRRVIEYAGAEHRRGYPHSYAERTVEERGEQLAREAAQGIIDSM